MIVQITLKMDGLRGSFSDFSTICTLLLEHPFWLKSNLWWVSGWVVADVIKV